MSELKIIGEHDGKTVSQMHNCMKVGDVAGGVLCADGHYGYAQPVGGVIAYRKQISISGVGFDIGCGNMAVQLGLPFGYLAGKEQEIGRTIAAQISFGVGRTNDTPVEHALFDDTAAWDASGMMDYRDKARSQLGTVGSGNHYVDIMRDEEDLTWIGIHFGSRGLGHTTATRYLKAAGGRDGMDVPPAVVDVQSEIGERYLAGMELAGRYAYAGREYVARKVQDILEQAIGGTRVSIFQTIHNHHNYAWSEKHGGEIFWVVRKGATPAFPGQKGFVGGSMGDDCVILEGVDSQTSADSFYSTIHGAGRLFGRKQAKRELSRDQMDQWLRDRGVTLIGADLDESPMAYRRLTDVLAHHEGTVKVLHRLHPVIVVMAGANEFDPFKD